MKTRKERTHPGSAGNPPGPADALARPGENIELMSFALSIIREAALLIDESFRFRYVNDEACRALEYPSADLLGMTLSDVDTDFDPARLPDRWSGLRDRGSLTLQRRFRTKSGRYFPVEISANYFEYDGHAYNFVLARDISERHQAEEAIRVNEERLRLALEATNDNVWDWNLTTDAIFFSPRWFTGLGYQPADFPSRFSGVRELVHPDDVPDFEKIIRQALDGEGGNVAEFRIRAADGSWRWIRGQGSVSARDEAGRPVRMSGTNTDITERKRAEEAVLLSETRLLATLDNTPNVAVQWYDRNGRVRYWNGASETFYGWKSSEAMGKTLDALIHTPEETAEFLRILNRIRETGEPYGPYEAQVHRRDGSGGWVLATTFGIPMGGDETGFVCMDVDITELKRAEDALRESEERLRSLAETAFEGIMIHENGIILEANLQFARLFGYDSPAELIGRNGIEFLLTPESRSIIRARLSEGPYLGTVEVSGMRRDGSTFLGETQSCESTYRGKKARVVAMRDITERRNMEDRLRQAEKLEAVGQLAGGVAHDFNNMLNVILGHAEMAMKRTGTDGKLAQNLMGIEKAARRSADLTSQLLTFARKQTITPRVVDVNHSIEGMMDMLRRMIHEGIRMVWTPGVDPCPVRIDPSQLVQILANLMVNARDAIGDVGRVSIGTSVVRLDETFCAGQMECNPGEYVRLDVSDDGCGMDEATRAHIFEPFFTTKPAGQGTGLGLATVYGIAKQNGGFIAVDSEPGRGTTFRVFLPLHAGSSVDEASPERAPGTPRGGRETILLVEDEPMVLEITRTVLDDLGYKVLAAASPGEALRLAAESAGAIDLLITDIVMPEMNGRDLAERLTSQYGNIRSLYMSGYSADVIAPRGILPEGVHFLQKPFPLQELAARVREVLGNAD